MKSSGFTEVQGFRHIFVWGAAIALNILFTYAIIQQVFIGRPFGSTPASDTVLILLETFAALLITFLFSIRLKTAISSDGIYYRFHPFQTKATLIEWEDLSDAYIREYNSFYEYGGWGIRIGNSQNDRAINTRGSGNLGLQLEFKDGKLLLIGTAKPTEVKKALDEQLAAGKIKWGR